MPLATPEIKVKAVRTFGGDAVTVKLHGINFDEAAAEVGDGPATAVVRCARILRVFPVTHI